MKKALALALIASAAVAQDEAEFTFGWSVANVGDTSGDGASDFAVGARGLGVRLFSGADSALLWHVTGVDGNADIGYSLAGASDVDGDGVADLVTGARTTGFRQPHGPPPSLAAVLSGVDGAVLTVLRSGVASDGFGQTIATVDLDGDAKREILVGAPHGGTGAVYVFSGAGKLLATVRGELEGDRFGSFLSPVDSARGVLVSAIGACAGHGRGRVSLLVGPELALIRDFEGTPGDGVFGSTACALPDVDSDGSGDIAIAVTLANDNLRPSGRVVRLFSGATGAEIREFYSGARGFDATDFGAMIVALDDWDRDGVADIAVSAPSAYFAGSDYGLVAFFSGRTGTPLSDPSMWTGDPIQRLYGTSLALLDDRDGDGARDLLVGAPDSFWRGGIEVLSSARPNSTPKPREGTPRRGVLRQLHYSDLMPDLNDGSYPQRHR